MAKPLLHQVLDLLPTKEREQIPRDKMGNQEVHHDALYRALSIRPPTVSLPFYSISFQSSVILF